MSAHAHGHAGHAHGGHGNAVGDLHHPGPASKRIVSGYGFWIFLLSDIVMFSAFFAAYAVLKDATAGGPTGRELFDLGNVAIETACLLASSFTCGMIAIAVKARNLRWAYVMAFATFVLGAVFLYLELAEFVDMVHKGAGPSRSAFLSSFFTLVGTHGLHVTLGLIWMLVLMVLVAVHGLQERLLRQMLCFSLFWHALDIIWVGVFTIVYLMGAAP